MINKKIKNAPRYIVIAEGIIDSIKNGNLRYGDYVPTEQTYVSKFRVSHGTIRNALELLEKKGYVSPANAKKRMVLYKDKEKKESKFHTVPCFGIKAQETESFVATGYNVFYDYLVEEFHKNNVNCPKILISPKGELPDILNSMQIDASLVLTAPANYDIYKKLPRPIIQYIYRYDCPADRIINLSSQQITINAVKYLCDRGHRNIGFIPSCANAFPYLDSLLLTGYQEAVRRHGMKEHILRMQKIDSFGDKLGELLKSLDSVINCGVDSHLFFYELNKLGIKIPQHLSFINIGPSLQINGVKICAYENDFRKIAEKTCYYILKVINGTENNDISIRDGYRFVDGETVVAR